jgi:hypothetical protein
MLYFFEPNVFFISFISGILSAAGSPTATLLRLHPSQRLYRNSVSPLKVKIHSFRHFRFPGCDGRCVQGPGTISPRHADTRLLAIPTSCRRVAAYNPD